MLPTKGYFTNVQCPFSKKECSRPYCHYRHCEGDAKLTEGERTEQAIKEVVKKTVNEVLSSRPIQEKMGQVNCDANKIINSVLKEIENKTNLEESTSEVPCYKPTPISELNKRHVPVILPPTKPTYSQDGRTNKMSIQNRKPNIRIESGLLCPIKKMDKSPLNSEFSYEYTTQEGKSPTTDVGVSEEIKSNVSPLISYYSTSEHCAPENIVTDKEENEADIPLHLAFHNSIETQKNSVLGNHINPADVTTNDTNNCNNCGKGTFPKEIISEKAKGEPVANSEDQDKTLTKRRRKKKWIKLEDKKEEETFETNSLKPPKPEDLTSGDKRKQIWDEDSSKKSKLEVNGAETDEEDFVCNESSKNEDIETISIHSSSSSSPTLEAFPDSPPPKRKKNLTTDSAVPQSESLLEKWKKARDTIVSKSKLNGKIRIQPVANVQILLKAKENILGRRTTDPSVEKKLEVTKELDQRNTVIKSVIRKSRVPVHIVNQCPNPIMEDSCRIPFYARQQSIKNLFDEFLKFRPAKVAFDSSQKLELELCRRVHIIKTYKNAIAVALLRIRKQKGAVFEKESPSETFAPNRQASFTNGWTMYKCFSKYLLTFDQYRLNGYPMKIKSREGCAFIEISARRSKVRKRSDEGEQTCDHCSKRYSVDERGVPLKEYDCFYHWGKLRRVTTCGESTERYTCCSGDLDSEPCTNGKYHVCNLFDDNLLEGFVTTAPQTPGQSQDEAGIYGIDCEMCYTTRGIELTRITLVDLNGLTVYDKIVVPDNAIIDYCTRFSGITEDIIKTSKLKLKDIQRDLLRMINENTILVGHSIENDMKVLRVFHKTFVDTSVVFPHKNGLPFKLSLKRIAKDLLNITIQEKDSGHDSYEDANACVQIMLWKIKEDAKKRKPRTIISLESKKI